MKAPVLIAIDLDRTLIYSRRFFDAPPSDGQCVEIYEGAPISFMTAIAVAELQDLSARHIVVPATTRTVAQYLRIRLPGGPHRFAVTSNGGSILVDGMPDREWNALVSAQVLVESAAIDEVITALRARVSDRWVHSGRVAEGLFSYLVVDETAMPPDFVESWRDWCAPRGWQVSQQGRKVYTVPKELCKSRAVREVRRRLVESGDLDPDASLFAAGDGALDAELLLYADAAIRPSHGELHALGWQSHHTTVTKLSGAAASEEILAWLQCRAARNRPPKAGSAR